MNINKTITAITLAICCLIIHGKEPNVKIHNLGRSGETSSEALNRFDKTIIPLKPDFLIIYYGMNDSLFTRKMVPPEKYRANLEQMIDKARRNGTTHIMLVSINPVDESIVKTRKQDHPGRENLNAYADKYNCQVRKTAKAKETLFFDLRQLVLDNGGPGGELVRNRSNGGGADGLHLTPAGYRLLAEGIYKLISPLVKDGSVIVCLGDSITYGVHVKGQGTIEGESYPAQLNQLFKEII